MIRIPSTIMLPLTIKTLMVGVCEKLTAVLITSIVLLIYHYIGCFFQWILMVKDVIKIKRDRLLRLCQNFCLLFIAVLYFVYNNVNPLLMSLIASYDRSFPTHVISRCLFMGTFCKKKSHRQKKKKVLVYFLLYHLFGY